MQCCQLLIADPIAQFSQVTLFRFTSETFRQCLMTKRIAISYYIKCVWLYSMSPEQDVVLMNVSRNACALKHISHINFLI